MDSGMDKRQSSFDFIIRDVDGVPINPATGQRISEEEARKMLADGRPEKTEQPKK